MTATIQRVHNPTTHRLDAGSVAELYGLKLAPLARMLRLNAESLQRRPDSPVAQEALRRLVHTWDTLAEI
ncbi:MAG: hypothetical protein M3Y21_10890, partial [Candidatus Eremiobacteraeota bacterium]|nr:hypothetical protein [Candidatus Eremiobacteraeota bacterium]